MECNFKFQWDPVHFYQHVILHLPTKFRPNCTVCIGAMTSYPFSKMAATAFQFYFRFLAQRDILVNSRRRPKTRSPWPTLLGFQGIVENAYICIICKQLTCGQQIYIMGASDRVQQLPGIWPTFWGHGSKWTKIILGQSQWHKSQPVYTETCNLVCAHPLAYPDQTPKTRSPWPTLLGF